MKLLIELGCIILFATFSCNIQKPVSLVGKYAVKHCNCFSKFTTRYYPIVDGSYISLNEDQTYNYESCATKSRGNWERQGNKLLLYCAESKLITNDSALSCGNGPEILEISGRKIIDKIKFMKKEVKVCYFKVSSKVAKEHNHR